MHPLTHPMAAMVLLTFVVLLTMLYIRVSSVAKGKTDARYFKTYDSTTPDRGVVQAQRHFANLFEMPVLFYAGCLLAIVQGRDSQLLVALAWAYVAFRALHAIIHMGPNKIYPRMAAFTLSCLVLAVFWAKLVIA
jgi:hypothetical protein